MDRRADLAPASGAHRAAGKDDDGSSDPPRIVFPAGYSTEVLHEDPDHRRPIAGVPAGRLFGAQFIRLQHVHEGRSGQLPRFEFWRAKQRAFPGRVSGSLGLRSRVNRARRRILRPANALPWSSGALPGWRDRRRGGGFKPGLCHQMPGQFAQLLVLPLQLRHEFGRP